MTLYRKYRPQKLSELDSSEVRERLIRVFSSSFTPHALLFSGSKGTGKTSAARIIAKVINCEKRMKLDVILSKAKNPVVKSKSGGDPSAALQDDKLSPDVEPCNSCETCISITEGRNLDVLEIDAASNRGIDEIRELREKIKFTPVSIKYKVYIIDEVHMLTTEAFNALLKTLEEPPAHAIFILATTEPEKLPATILSRCIIFNFKKATDEEIIHCLSRVVKGEKIEAATDLLGKIAHASEGSFRDATKILEQAILENAFTGEKLSLLLGRDSLTAENFLKLLATKETSDILSQVNKMLQTGVNFRYLIEDVLNLLHRILLAKHNIEENKVDASLARLFEVKEILTLVKLFSRTFVELKNTNIAQLPLEVAVVEWCEGKN